MVYPTAPYRNDGKTRAFEIAFLEINSKPFGRGKSCNGLLRTLLPLTLTSPKCPQPREPNNTDIFQSHLDYPSDVTESEFDCLNLFITRPATAALQQAGCSGGTGVPVMVWIHGGGFGWGAGSDPSWGIRVAHGACPLSADVC